MVAKKRKKSVKRGVAAKSKGSHGPKDTELADIAIRSSRANMSKATASDGTEPKGAQKVLEEKQNLNELLLDSLPHTAMLIRKDRRILAANRPARDAGAKVEDYCWQSFAQSDFIPEEDKKYMDEHKQAPPGGTCCCFCLADKALKNQKPARHPELNAWGKIWDVHWVPLDEQTYLHYALDITDYRIAEKSLQESEIRYKTLFESSPDGIVIADVETRKFPYVNPAMCRMLGYSKEELTTMGVDDIHPKEALGDAISEFESQARGEKTLAKDMPCLRKDRTLVYTDINTVQSVVDGRECNIGFFRDITERKEAQKDLSEKNIALREVLAGIREQKNEMGRTILSNVDKIIMPLIHVLEPGLSEEQQRYMDLLKQSLQEIASPFVSRLSTTVGALTPTEMRICGLIRRELSNKEIAQLEHISPATVSKHRAHIRRKLGITNKKVNLATHLESFMAGQEET